jgi:sugar phosphate isomerase/epimerase
MNSRREFIKQSSLLVAAATILPSFACTAANPAKHVIGLQLYSLRDVIKNDIKGILTKVAAIGYKEVETFGYSLKDGFWGFNAKDFKKLLDDNGLKSPSGHFGFDYYIETGKTNELKNSIDAAKILGSEYVTVPYLQAPLRKTEDQFKQIADKLNVAAEMCKAAGLKLAYHNHDFEFTKFGNTTGLEILLNGVDKSLMDFELDLYWVVRSGNDPLKLFKKYPGRFTMWHIKDMNKSNHDVNAEIGQGAIDFKSIFSAAALSGVKHYFVEHEFNYKPDEMTSVKTSFNYVNNELLK